MDDYFNFKPEHAVEKQYVEYYNNLSRFISAKIRGLNEKDRLIVLRDLDMSDLSLMNLYLQAFKQEDYETCAVAKVILGERGLITPNLEPPVV